MNYFFPDEPIHITVPGRPDDPRGPVQNLPGIVVHYSPPLHSDDLTVVEGIPCTSVARTLVDCAEVMDREELVDLFLAAEAKGLLDIDAVKASRARVEWRPSLAMLDELIAQFS